MDQSLPPLTDRPPPSDLKTRAIVGVILIAIALGALWAGGLWFTGFVAAGVLLVFAEWAVMHGITRGWRLLGLALLGGACLAAHLGFTLQALVGLAVASLLLGLLTKLAGVCGMRWSMTGLLYAGLPAIALIWLRAQSTGFLIVLWVLLTVCATDIFAYFAGRSIGGPKIAPKISPKKTWAGLAGGVIGAGAVGGGFAAWADGSILLWIIIGAGLAVAAQVGDFFESWLKRRVGVKDSGTLLPGHGGVMDRVDGLIPVACLAALMVAWGWP